VLISSPTSDCPRVLSDVFWGHPLRRWNIVHKVVVLGVNPLAQTADSLNPETAMAKRNVQSIVMTGSPTGPIRSELAGDAELADLIEQFVHDLPARAESLLQAARHAQFDQVRRMAHQLKGACGGYGFPQIGEVAGSVEQQSSSGAPPSNQDVERLLQTVNELNSMCKRAAARWDRTDRPIYQCGSRMRAKPSDYQHPRAFQGSKRDLDDLIQSANRAACRW